MKSVIQSVMIVICSYKKNCLILKMYEKIKIESSSQLEPILEPTTCNTEASNPIDDFDYDYPDEGSNENSLNEIRDYRMQETFNDENAIPILKTPEEQKKILEAICEQISGVDSKEQTLFVEKVIGTVGIVPLVVKFIWGITMEATPLLLLGLP